MSTGARILTLVAIAALAAGGPARPATDTPAPRRNIGGPGDYSLRETLIRRLGRDGEVGGQRLTVILVNGGVVFSGEVASWTMRRRVLSIAAEMRGVINVTDQMTIRPAGLPDEALRRAVTGLLTERAATLELKDLAVRAEGAVVTLSGTARDFRSRVEAEAIAGTVLGIVRIDNGLRPANAPSGSDDPSIAAAVAAYLGDAREYPYPGEIEVRVANGVVSLRGQVAYCLARQQALVMAGLVGGVVRVEPGIEVDPSVQMPQAIVKVAR